MSGGFRIRPAGVGESDAVALVHRASFDAAMPNLVGLHTPDEDCWFFRERVFPSSEVWVADDDGVCGYCAVEDDWLNQLYVHPRHWARGIGRALLEQARLDRLVLQFWTFQRNARARRFYEANGFVLAETTDGSGNEEREPDAHYIWSRQRRDAVSPSP